MCNNNDNNSNNNNNCQSSTAVPQTPNHSTTSCSRNVTLLFALFTISLSSGLVYGWPALRRNLLLYEKSTLSENQFGIIFTAGSWSSLGSRLLMGIARDRYLGTRMAVTLSLLGVAGGCAGMAFSPKDDLASLSVSYFWVGVGSGAQLCLQPLADLFEERMQGLVLATTSGAYQVSGLVFWVLMEMSGNRRRFSLGVFAVVLCGVALVGLRVLPRGFFVSKGTTVEEEEEKVQNPEEQQPQQEQRQEEEDGQEEEMQQPIMLETTTETRAMVEKNDDGGVLALMKTWEYILLLVWLSLQLIPLQYYVATIGFQMERKGDDSGRYITFFPFMYAAAALFAPIFGTISDRWGLGIGQGLANILSVSSLFVLSSNSIPLSVHVMGMAFYGIGRMAVFGTFFSNLGKRFGYQYYGTLAGVGVMSSAVTSLLQYPLIALAAAGNEPQVNILCGTILALQGFPYCWWLHVREKRGCKPTDVLQR